MNTDWDALGRSLGGSLGALHAIVVCGRDADAAARVALGLASAQAQRRRVTVADLIGDVPALHDLAGGDDIHGIVDSFLYGVSLTRIARRVASAGELYVMPTGSEPPDYESLLAHPRWARLTAEFRESGALLVVVVPSDAPRVTDLVAQLDGAVIVGDDGPTTVPVAQVISVVRGRRTAEVVPSSASPGRPTPPGSPPRIHDPAVTDDRILRLPGRSPSGKAPRERFTLSLAGAATLGLTIALGLLLIWLVAVPLPRWLRNSSIRPFDTTLVGSAAGSFADSLSSEHAGSSLAPANPADSTVALAYAVELLSENTDAGAILRLRADGATVPAETFAPELIQGSIWFKVQCGAFTNRAGADSLLADLRSRNVLKPTEGVVVRTPYAFLIDSGVAATAIPDLLAELIQRGLPVYALRQDNGTAWILAGAFENPAQATLYEGSLRTAAMVPQLVFRKGRMF